MNLCSPNAVSDTMIRLSSVAALTAVLAGCLSCGSASKIGHIRQEGIAAGISLPKEELLPQVGVPDLPMADTLFVNDLDGKRIMIMKAVKDENGEMVATDVLPAAVVSARFRNVAERHGMVDLMFRITVPEQLQDDRWQIRFLPVLSILDETRLLEPVFITGKDFRRNQLRGYERYRRFLDSIVKDTTLFIDSFQLEMFIQRNLPGIYRFKTDSSYVSEAEFASEYGVTERQAIDHYTDRIRLNINRRKINRRDRMFKRYVKSPIIREGLRLDTVIQAVNGDLHFDYVQTIKTRPGLRKAMITLEGDIFEDEKKIYEMPACEALTFYISSFSTMTDNTERFLTKIIERKVNLHTACYIEFGVNSSAIEPSRGHNPEEMSRIRENLFSLMDNTDYELDSVEVTASCSPEGSFRRNRQLSLDRSESVSTHFRKMMQAYADSLNSGNGMVIGFDGAGELPVVTPVPFLSRTQPENWAMLDALVQEDTTLTRADKSLYASLSGLNNLDERELKLRKAPGYIYMREHLYPRLRTVRFDFHLHRKGMVKDTVHTTVPDTLYMNGVAALKDRDYEKALTLLRPYEDYNAAVACVSMDYNATAMSILEKLDKTARVHYLMAIVHARRGENAKAVEHYMLSCRLDRNFVHRGNLDPEISSLIKNYNLNPQNDI